MLIVQTNQPILSNQSKMNKTIAQFWDKISEGWRMVWGPHIHHGFYEDDQKQTPLAAQEQLIERLTILLSINPNDRILDVGCGMGGSSIYLAQKYNAHLNGITLSKKQVTIATKQAEHKKLENVYFKVEDALSLSSFQDEIFDIVWSLESCEQFYDKKLFLEQAYRVLKPGGKLLLVTWCSAQDEYMGDEAKTYLKLCEAFDLPYMPSIQYYKEALIQRFKLVICQDWSRYVARSWDIGINLVNAFSYFKILKIAGIRGLRFTKQIKMMRDGFRNQRIQYGVFVAKKEK